MLAHPDVPVQTEDQIYSTGQSDEVGLEAADEDRRNLDQLAVAQLRECQLVSGAEQLAE